jgi:hypothetical protein
MRGSLDDHGAGRKLRQQFAVGQPTVHEAFVAMKKAYMAAVTIPMIAMPITASIRVAPASLPARGRR